MKPLIVIDAILAKKNLGTHRGMAPITIALGPGFSAPQDVDVVIETMRGHRLGRLYFEGTALPNTGIPGEIMAEKVRNELSMPLLQDKLPTLKHRGSRVERGSIILYRSGSSLFASDRDFERIDFRKGNLLSRVEVCDVDPRPVEKVDCLTISDKARALGERF